LFLSFFNIRTNVNKVNVKYSIKNNKINGNDVFLAATNQKRAIKSSRRNFRLIATRVYTELAFISISCPFKKISNEVYDVTKNISVSHTISDTFSSSLI
jgi:hypothetical protein